VSHFAELHGAKFTECARTRAANDTEVEVVHARE